MNAPALHLNVALLPKRARADFDYWRALVEPLLGQTRGVVASLEATAAREGVEFRTLRTKYYAAKKHGLIALVNKRLAGPAWWALRGGQAKISAEDQDLVKLYCENNQRSTKTAIKTLILDWRAGRVQTTTPVNPGTGLPRGWTPRNLARYAPTKYQLKATRIGTSAAASERRLVYSTRKGLWVGSHYMFDDMWHDFMVNSFAERQAGRPLELFSHDLFSARKVRWGVRVRTTREDGKANGLTERMTRMILAATLSLDGYSPRGTVLVAEHGTAAISERIERDLYDLTGKLITVSRSGMQGAAAHAGQYSGIVRGNPRHKASLESSNNLTHNVFASLPGQTGKDRQHQPEQLPALLRHNEALLAAQKYLSPERAALLQFPILELNQFMAVAHELYSRIEADPEHDLEGWVECGHVVNELMIAGQWIDQRKLLAEPAQAELALALIASGSLQARPRKMSRREVWDMGCGELVRLPGFGVVAILGDDLAKPRKVRKGMFEFEDAEVGPGDHRYDAACITPHGERLRLAEGETYETFVNPFAPDVLFVRRANGSYLGECARITTPCRGNVEAMQRACGAAAAAEAEALAPVRERHSREIRQKAAMHRRNELVLKGRPVTEAEILADEDRREAIASVTAADRDALLAPDPDFEAETPDRTATLNSLL